MRQADPSWSGLKESKWPLFSGPASSLASLGGKQFLPVLPVTGLAILCWWWLVWGPAKKILKGSGCPGTTEVWVQGVGWGGVGDGMGLEPFTRPPRSTQRLPHPFSPKSCDIDRDNPPRCLGWPMVLVNCHVLLELTGQPALEVGVLGSPF